MVASLREDKYGFVQSDISGILQALLDCVDATEQFIQRPPYPLRVEETLDSGQLLLRPAYRQADGKCCR